MSAEKTVQSGLIACDVFEAELGSRLKEMEGERLTVRWLEMGEHDFPDRLRGNLQSAINELEELGCGRILFAYGLCSNSLAGLCARKAELIIPRAHDCITLFLGDKQRYAEISRTAPGTYWYSPGWCRGNRVPHAGYFEEAEKRYREQFDEDEADYLVEMERLKYAHYQVAAFTHLGEGDVEASRQTARASADMLGLEFREFEGDSRLIDRLLEGPWQESDFIILKPGQTAAYSGDESILKCVNCPHAGTSSSDDA